MTAHHAQCCCFAHHALCGWLSCLVPFGLDAHREPCGWISVGSFLLAAACSCSQQTILSHVTHKISREDTQQCRPLNRCLGTTWSVAHRHCWFSAVAICHAASFRLIPKGECVLVVVLHRTCLHSPGSPEMSGVGTVFWHAMAAAMVGS